MCVHAFERLVCANERASMCNEYIYEVEEGGHVLLVGFERPASIVGQACVHTHYVYICFATPAFLLLPLYCHFVTLDLSPFYYLP